MTSDSPNRKKEDTLRFLDSLQLDDSGHALLGSPPADRKEPSRPSPAKLEANRPEGSKPTTPETSNMASEIHSISPTGQPPRSEESGPRFPDTTLRRTQTANMGEVMTHHQLASDEGQVDERQLETGTTNKHSTGVRGTTHHLFRHRTHHDTPFPRGASGTELSSPNADDDQDLTWGAHLTRLGSNLRQGISSVIDSIAPPIEHHEMFQVHSAINMGMEHGLDNMVHRGMENMMEIDKSVEVLCQPSRYFLNMSLYHVKRGETLNLPKGLHSGSAVAQKIISKVAEHDFGDILAVQRHVSAESIDSYRTQHRIKNSPLVLVLQPYADSYTMSGSTLVVILGVLYDVVHDLTVTTLSQAFNLNTWLASNNDADSMELSLIMSSVELLVKVLGLEYLERRAKSQA
ncbi:hypothetical protein IWQ61_004228 [Dispira simplex]|nr:hypothetical protein IWQ61_004228 [Dispira simplex]